MELKRRCARFVPDNAADREGGAGNAGGADEPGGRHLGAAAGAGGPGGSRLAGAGRCVEDVNQFLVWGVNIYFSRKVFLLQK